MPDHSPNFIKEAVGELLKNVISRTNVPDEMMKDAGCPFVDLTAAVGSGYRLNR